MNVVAEGVDNKRQIDILRGLGCEYAQGFLFSVPVDADAATELIKIKRIIW